MVYTKHNKPSDCKYGFLSSPYYYRTKSGKRKAKYCKTKPSRRRNAGDPTRASQEPWERNYRKRRYGRASIKGKRQR